jgi:hypothetical protein
MTVHEEDCYSGIKKALELYWILKSLWIGVQNTLCDAGVVKSVLVKKEQEKDSRS